MTGPTLDVTLDPDTEDAIVIAGVRGPGWYWRPGFQMPGLEQQTYTPDGGYFHGDEPTEWKWVNGIISGNVTGIFDTVADLNTAVAAMRTALGRLSFPLLSNWNGVEQTWKGLAGARFVPAPMDLYEVDKGRPTFALSIPVYPIPGSP